MSALTKKERMYQRIYNHGLALNSIFNTEYDPITLCKKLRRIEREAENLAIEHCNYGYPEDEWERATDAVLAKVDRVLGFKNAGIPVFFNGDPRGYALKIDSDYMLACERNSGISVDWGGYGLIAPDLSED